MKDREEYISILEQDNAELKKQLEERPKEYVFIGNAQNKTRDFINQIVKENKGLKKQLENNLKINIADHKYASECEDKVITLNTQQKEFIKFLEDEIKIYSNTYMGEILKELEEILQKYKEIIGVSDENRAKI